MARNKLWSNGSRSTTMSTRLFWSWRVWFGYPKMYLSWPLDRIWLFKRYVNFFIYSFQKIVHPNKMCFKTFYVVWILHVRNVFWIQLSFDICFCLSFVSIKKFATCLQNVWVEINHICIYPKVLEEWQIDKIFWNTAHGSLLITCCQHSILDLWN